MKFLLLFYITFQTCFPLFNAELKFYEEKHYHIPRSLSNHQLSFVTSLYNDTYFQDALSKILVPRVVGTPSHEAVRKYISSELKQLGWVVEENSFKDVTPNRGELLFTNIVGKLNPDANRFLVLACHYDSKFFPDADFLGATDSAVPCAMLLALAHSLRETLSFAKISNPSLMLIFFDGEEAFLEWSDTDSLYGARHLAAQWESSPYPTPNSNTNQLDRMDLLVLLDLIGAKNPMFYSFFQNTARWHSLMANIERRLKAMNLISPRNNHHFLEKSTFSHIADDHLPFLERNVPVVHLITNPFPKVWHTLKDDYSALDFPTIKSVFNVLQVFIVSYLKGETSK